MKINQENIEIFNYQDKELYSSLVLSSPHSGNYYPKDFLSLCQIDPLKLCQNEDSLVDKLFKFPLLNKNVFLKAIWSRSVVDVNRSINDFQKNDFNPQIKNIASNPSKYALSGIGGIPSRSGVNEKIYSSSISGLIASSWLEIAWSSYHDHLSLILNKALKKYNHYILLDFHSMPSSVQSKSLDADIVLGDCYGKTTTPKILNFIEKFFITNGLKVKKNFPYSGGYITENYGDPSLNRHSLQIEINRPLYLNEKTRTKNSNFYNCQKLVTDLVDTVEKNKDELL